MSGFSDVWALHFSTDQSATDQALRNIRWDVRRYAGLAEQSDDLTMVGLRVREA